MLWIRPEAESDIQNTFRWYEEQRIGLGHEFLLSFEAALEHLQTYPLSGPRTYRLLRRLLLRRFPYGVYYIIYKNRVVIVACFHCHRDPRWMLAERTGS